MKHESHCSRVPQQTIDASLAATRSQFKNLLTKSCQAAGQDTICPELDARLTTCLDHFLPAYVRADLSACRYYRAYAWASTAVFILGALAVIIVATQHIFHLPHPIVIGEIACIGMILFIFHWGNRRRLHRTWVDCRHFAERVRNGLFLAFLCDKTVVPEGLRWSDQDVDGFWCDMAFEELMRTRAHTGPLSPRNLGVLRRFMVDHWLTDQQAYHEKKAAAKGRRHKIISQLGEACFGATLIAALLHLVPHEWREAWHVEHVMTDNVLTFMAIALPAIGTALAGIRGHFEFKKTAARSRMIAMQLGAMVADAGKIRELTELSEVALRAEALMVQENADWHLHASIQAIPSEG